MAIACIAILSVLFKIAYPSVELESVVTVLALLGFAVASASYYLIRRVWRFKKGGQKWYEAFLQLW